MNSVASSDRETYAIILARAASPRRRRRLVGGCILAVVGASVVATGLADPARLMDGLPAMGQLLSEMAPPNFTNWQSWLRPIADTLAMSIAGTALAISLSLPLALAAAPNTNRNAFGRFVARFVLNALRSVPELILGIFFVAAVGFGALPGVLALGLHSVGMVGKFFAEAIEHVDPGPVDAARAAGARPLQVITHAILPQVLPRFIDTALYRWEYNFRASTVLGVVGAGGIGFQLIAALRVLSYDEVAAIMLCILACVTVVDGLGGFFRRRLK
jgi:phosphonate transport system permease protein